MLFKVVDDMSMSVSFKKSSTTTNLKHNNREFTEKQKEKNSHIDFERTHENKSLAQKDLKELYEQEFAKPLEKYNDKQKRNDRKIDNYYQHIKDSKKTSLQQEMIIQVGDKDDFKNEDDFEKANEILEDWFEDFEERNPNLKVYNAVIHNDEASPHLHLNFVPVASDYKRGLEKQVSFDRAIKQQDKTLDKRRPFKDWRDKEVNLVAELLQERGIERKLVGTNDYKDVNEYKEKKDLKREIKTLEKDLSQKKNELSALTKRENKTVNLENIGYKEETKKTLVSSKEQGFKGYIPKMEDKKTGNVILPRKTFNIIKKDAEQNKELQATVEKYLETDLVKENKKLRSAYRDMSIKFDDNKLDYDRLSSRYDKVLEINKDLKDQVKSLKKEVKVIYNNVKDFIKERTPDKETFKSMFKTITDDVKERVAGSEFERIDKQENKRTRSRGRGR